MVVFGIDTLNVALNQQTNNNQKKVNYSTVLDKNLVREDSNHYNNNNNNNSSKVNSVVTMKNSLEQRNGWLRIYCGPDRSDLIITEPSRIVHCFNETTISEIVKELNLPREYTIWMQIGGGDIERLAMDEKPLKIQDNFYRMFGYTNSSRRSRLDIDPEMKYILRFFIGPSESPLCKGILKSGYVDILKGLVFPQWKRRCIAVIGNQLYIFPASSNISPEVFCLSGADIIEHAPCHDRLILKIIPKYHCEKNRNFYIKDNKKVYCNSNNNNNSNDSSNIDLGNMTKMRNYNSVSSVHNSSLTSINSTSYLNDQEKVLFFGFIESWERDLWSKWLLEATISITDTKDSHYLDIGNSGLQTIPEIILESLDEIQELCAGQNKLQEIGLKALSQFQKLQILRLPGNGFKSFPSSVLMITNLTVLDLADNLIDQIPSEIFHLEYLEELRLDRNELTELPNSLRFLRYLKSLYVSRNRIIKLPPFLMKMRTMGLVDMYSQKSSDLKLLNINHQQQKDKNDLNPPLTKISLRSNNLKGRIILGNYGNLTQLDISENNIESLDLSALDRLESLQCCRNKLKELILNGHFLTTLIAGNNELITLSINPQPMNLKHLDVSYNNLTELPYWLSNCHNLQTFFANNNHIQNLPKHLFCNELNALHTLQLGYNKLKVLPAMPLRKLPLQELFLQCNEIEELPENFFYACENLVILNISCNKISTLPVNDNCSSQLERLYATKNHLNDRIFDTLVALKKLRIFHAAYNQLTTFPEECVQNWPEIEELSLSGNRIQHIPDNLVTLSNLKVLRLHSNQLQSVPSLSKIVTLRVLDLAHNQLDKINLTTLLPKKLQFLDLSCNMYLQVDPHDFQTYRSQRKMSLVDVSGKDRISLPTTPDSYQENSEHETPWKVGFSETAGNAPKLYISQLRLQNFCNVEGLFGIFDGELNSVMPNFLVKVIPKILLEERTMKETANEYMKYTLLSSHKEFINSGQKHGVSATLCHILRENIYQSSSNTISNRIEGTKFVLRVASVGNTSAFLLRTSGHVSLTPQNVNQQRIQNTNFPLIMPDPEVCEVNLGGEDEYLLMCNKKLIEVLDIEYISKEIYSKNNVILAAKRIQDIAQSLGAEDNLSIILIKFNNLGTNADQLVRELRQTVRKKTSGIMSNFCKCGCCCESNNSCCHSAGSMQFIRQFSGRSDRSSPSGQSDHTTIELNSIKNNTTSDIAQILANRNSNLNHHYLSNEKRSLRGGVVRAVRAKIEEEKEHEREQDLDETDSAVSEEQFKCWEYMLEQNTQLLFDKELNTISRAFTKNKNSDKINSSSNGLNTASNLIKAQNNKMISASSPQLIYGDINQPPIITSSYNNSFLSKHFGSARSFHPTTPNLFKSMRFNSSGRLPPIGGPNAAYFGSLQRLMPYNLEYDFAIMHERNMQDDSLEHEARIRQYWGVATTEL